MIIKTHNKQSIAGKMIKLLLLVLIYCLIISCNKHSQPVLEKTLTIEPEKKMLYIENYRKRRNLYNAYLSNNNIHLHTCPGCGFPTLESRGNYEICSVCNWEDDMQDDKNEDENWGGPNKLSLTDNRIHIGQVLENLEIKLNGKLNNNPEEVLEILNAHNKNMNAIGESIPMDADLSHKSWDAWKSEKEALLKRLIKPN